MKVKVKICGIRSFETAQVAVNTGADFIGFNFVPSSKRFIEPEICNIIINDIRGKVKIVGVFQNENSDKVNKVAELLNLDLVQLHGVEDESYIDKIERPIIKSINTDSMSYVNANYLLLDRIEQGKGDMVDFQYAKKISGKNKIFYAGGLTPKNVASVINKIKPFAVDVAGGIETEGKEDMQKIKQFIVNAKGVEI